MMGLPLRYRLAIYLLIALASGALFFRTLILLVLAIVFLGLFLMASRILAGFTSGRTAPSAEKGKGFIDSSSYKVLDDKEEPSG